MADECLADAGTGSLRGREGRERPVLLGQRGGTEALRLLEEQDATRTERAASFNRELERPDETRPWRACGATSCARAACGPVACAEKDERMSGYVLSVEAELDLEEIWDWIARTASTLRTDGLKNFSMHWKGWGGLRESDTSARTSRTCPCCSGQSTPTSSSTA